MESHPFESALRLQFRCSGLAKLDLLSKSDPVINVMVQRSDCDEFERIGCTEIKHND